MAFPFDPNPATIWTLQKEGKMASCEARFVPNGTQVTITRNGKPLYSQVFGTGQEATAHAKAERVRMVDAGWAQNNVTGRSC